MTTDRSPTAAQPEGGDALRSALMTYRIGEAIRTPHGRVRAERLKPGDRVHVEGQGAAHPVRWVIMQRPCEAGAVTVHVMLDLSEDMPRATHSGVSPIGHVSPKDGKLRLQDGYLSGSRTRPRLH